MPERGPRALVLLVAGTLLLAQACTRQPTPEEREHLETIQAMRTQTNAFMRSEESPLPILERARFRGLRYFEPNLALRFEGALEIPTTRDTVFFTTSSSGKAPYLRFGVFRFEHDGKQHALTIYQSFEPQTLFVPFLDTTSGKDTYGAGRYVDPEPLPDGRYRIDFNHAYNPYCAYNSSWICPLPPVENKLDIRIDAGEKNYTPPA